MNGILGEPGIEGNAKKVEIATLLERMDFTLAIWTIFMIARGLSYFEVFLVWSMFNWAQLLFEPLSGVFADKYGRKNAILISLALNIISCLVFYFAHNLWMFLLGNFLGGVCSSFMSDTKEALVYDSLAAVGKEAEYKKIYAGIASMSELAAVIAPPIGSIAAKYNLSWPILLCIIPVALSALLFLAVEEPKHAKEIGTLDYWHILKTSFTYLKGHEILTTLTFNVSISWPFLYAIYYTSQPHFQASGIGVEYFGFIFTAAYLLSFLVTRMGESIDKWFGSTNLMFAFTFIPGLIYILMSQFFDPIVSIFGFVLILGLFSVRWPLSTDYLNRHIESKNRATVLSLVSTAYAVSGIVFKPVIGYFTNISLATGFLFCGVMLILISFAFRVEKV